MSIKESGIPGNDTNVDFFYKKHQKYSPYSMEFKKIDVSSIYNYNQDFTVEIPKNCDILHRCFFEVILPVVNLSDSIIKNQKYIDYKKNILSNIQTKIDLWKTKYDDFYNYSNIMIIIYNDVKTILKLDNLTLDYLKNRVLALNDTYSENINSYKLKIDANIISYVDISTYILNLTDINSDIESQVDKMYNYINNYLNYYYSNYNYYNINYNKKNSGKIDYYWNDNLAHYMFDNIELNIDGQMFDNYSNDYIHINNTHNIHIDYKEIYNNVIGNNDKIYDNNGYDNYIYCPLLFWFCKDITKSLPIGAMNNSKININGKLTDKKNVVYFQDWGKMYDELLTVYVPREEHNVNDEYNTIQKINLEYDKVELLLPENIYKYTCSKVTKELLDLHFTGIDSQSIINNYSSDGTYLTKDDYIYLMNNIKTETLLSENTKIEIAGYHYFVDYNYLLNLVGKPKISLLCEYGYVDDVEKSIMKNTELKYLVEVHNEIIIDVENNDLYDNLNEFNGLVKDIYYYSQLKLNKTGLSKYGKYENSNYTNKYIDSVELRISNEYNAFENINNNDYHYLTSSLPDGVQYTVFNLHPENNNQPSGCVNFNDIKGINIMVLLDTDNYNEYYTSKNNPSNLGSTVKIIYTKYNQLIVSNGKAQLTYY
jgi:hypothetical protein